MKVIDIINRINNEEELPNEIYYNGDYGELVKDKYMTNYIMYDKNDKFNMYWLINHSLNNLNDEIQVNLKVLLKNK